MSRNTQYGGLEEGAIASNSFTTSSPFVPVLSFQSVLAALSVLQLGLRLHDFLPAGLLLDAQHLVFALQTHHRLPVEENERREEEEEEEDR